MDIGKEERRIVIEPVPDIRETPAPEPEKTPAKPVEEPVPA